MDSGTNMQNITSHELEWPVHAHVFCASDQMRHSKILTHQKVQKHCFVAFACKKGISGLGLKKRLCPDCCHLFGINENKKDLVLVTKFKFQEEEQ